MNLPSHVKAYPAPAKLNLDLRITGRRADGYHNLESIFTLVSLSDTVYIAPRNDKKIMLHTPTPNVSAEQDLSYRAAKLLQTASGCNLGADIWLEKRIPVGGGLGGGSSDAATVLTVLNRLWNTGFSKQQLIELSLTLGADVPFFIFGENAFARGIGEELSPFSIPKQWYIIVHPQIHIPTVEVFSDKNLTRDSKPSIMPTFQSLQPFRNDMQKVVLEKYQQVYDAYQYLLKFGEVRLTGSGSCLFLSKENIEEAENIYQLVSQVHECYLAEGLDIHPLFHV